MSPKSLLRHPLCVSPLSDFTTKSGFEEVIPDNEVKANKARRLLFCTGKVYYDLLAYRMEHGIDDVAIVRIEQLYPFPKSTVDKIMKSYAKAEHYWVQEESQNNGAWSYILGLYRNSKLEVISRTASASPATGYKKVHDQQQEELIKKAFG